MHMLRVALILAIIWLLVVVAVLKTVGFFASNNEPAITDPDFTPHTMVCLQHARPDYPECCYGYWPDDEAEPVCTWDKYGRANITRRL